ncbi:MAG: DNA alkylation repair protein [Terriglobales bacterium]
MRRKPATPAAWTAHLRQRLRDGGSPAIARSTQRFFTEPVRCYGWKTAELRRFARQTQREVLAEGGLPLLLDVADRLFAGKFTDEKNLAVLLLENQTKHFGDTEFRRFERWLHRITNWSEHDALVHYLIGPLVASDRRRVARALAWARSEDLWHRRAAAVSLIHATRRRLFFREITWLSDQLLTDENDMVQKGLGWLLRETAKAAPARTVPYLMKIRLRAPRLVLRTACETLPVATRKRLLTLSR